MIILKRGKITYYVKDETVIVNINDFQFLAYTVYTLQNRKPFYDFRKTLLRSNENEYGTVVEQIKLGESFGLKAVASHKPSETELNQKTNISR